MLCKLFDTPLTRAALGVVFLTVALVGCAKPGGGAASGKPLVFVSVAPQADFVKRIAGDKIEVRVMVGAGQDPHNYAVEPAQSVALGKAAAFFTAGMPFEASLVKKIETSGMGIRVFDTTAGIELMEGAPHDHGEEGDEHAEHDDHTAHREHADEQDPHVWTAPELIKKQARVIADGLAEIDPENAPDYRSALSVFEDELDSLHRELNGVLAPFKGRRFYVFHPAFSYFAREYGLEQVPVQIGGQTPTQKELADFLVHAREDGIRVLFVQPQFDARAAKTIAAELGAKVVALDPLDENVLGNLRVVAKAIAAAFSPDAPEEEAAP
jgi:zinc transport system substrate-binding protein